MVLPSKVSVLGNQRYFGSYKTVEEAAAVAEAARKKQWEVAEQHELERRKTPRPKVDLKELDLI